MLLRSLLLLLLLIHCNSQAQSSATQREQDITSLYSNYFKANREKIHLHLNKTVYLNEETIWFKGYIIEEKNKLPFPQTANVYIDLLDEKGAKIQSELYYSSNGILEGYIPLDKKTVTGNYFIRAYTNFMNNFKEDESALYKIRILNPSDPATLNTNSKLNLNALTVRYFPESGVFLENTANTMGIKITDCNEKPVAIQDGSIVNSKGVVVTRFSTNENGIGRFDLLQNQNAPYKAVFTINNTSQSFDLPTPKPGGYTFSINNYTLTDKAFLKIRSATPVTVDTQLSLIIQQDEKVSLIENLILKKGTNEETFTINNDHFYSGINTITLIDPNNKKLADRLIFKPYSIQKTSAIAIAKKRNDSIVFKGSSNIPLASLSISVVPEKSVATGDSRSLYDTFIFSTYLEHYWSGNPATYLTDFSRNKHYELDTYLITQKPKYDFETIFNTPASDNKYEFQTGITLKGTINKPLSDRSKYFVEMSAFFNSIKKQSEINDKNEFFFNNVILSDSTKVSFILQNRKGKIEEIPMSIQVLKGQNVFLKQLPQLPSQCPDGTSTTDKTEVYSFPYVRDMKVVQLNDVNIKKAPKAPVLKNAHRFSNSMARGFKISSGDYASFREVLPFIGAHGFDVIYKNGDVYINNRITRSLRGNPSPAVFVDDVPLQPDLTMLIGMSLDMVEEIYISKNGYGLGMDGGSGYIRIYTKRYMGTSEPARSKAQSYVIKKAFQPYKSFKNPDYLDYDAGFINYGTINWIPNVETDENGAFTFSIPNYNQKSIKIKIEGIGSNGELISEEKILHL